MEFTVIDKVTGKEADIERIALTEEWAKGLAFCDMDGFAITECGDLILLDECGRYVDVSPERFEVRFAETIKDTDLPQTSPIPGIPRIKVYSKDGKLLAEGYYAFHINRQPCIMGDELKPDDCDHCLITDGFADWNMPKKLEVKKIVPEGGWIEVVV